MEELFVDPSCSRRKATLIKACLCVLATISAPLANADELIDRPTLSGQLTLVKRQALQCLADKLPRPAAATDSSAPEPPSSGASVGEGSGIAPDPLAPAAKLLAAKNPLPAVISLLNWRSTVPESAPPPDLYWGLLVQGLIDSGQIEWASRLMRDPAAHFSSAATPSTFLLEIAEWDYAHGDLDAAQKALDELKGSTPSNSSTLWQDLQSRLLLSEGKYDEAFSLLSVGKQNDPAQSAFGVSDTRYPFMRYNLGVALINMGRVDEGRTILDRLGKIPAKTDELRALRDKANLTLGWQLLKSKQGETALTVLGRVSIDGPFSNRALLGSGWAKLIGAGANQSLKFTDLDGSRANQLPSNVVASLTRNGLIDCEDANHYYGYAMQPCVGHRIGRSKLPLEKEALLKRALVPWIELSQRNPYDQAVQESWVAIPFALQQIEAFEQAATYYDLAIQRFESLRAEYAAAISAAKANSLLPAPNLGANAPSTGPGSRFDKEHIATLAFLLQVIPENVWNSPLQDERDLRWLAQQLTVSGLAPTDAATLTLPTPSIPSCDPSLAANLLSAAADLHKELEQRAALELQAQDEKLAQYLLSAREARAKSLEGLWRTQETASTTSESQLGPVSGFFHSIKTFFSGDTVTAPSVLPDESPRH